MRTCFKEHIIISATLKHNNNIEEITSYIKELAGPKSNFYSDIQNYTVESERIFGICNKNLTILTNKGNFNFDLSKNNILAL